jgi:hypothetical protein
MKRIATIVLGVVAASAIALPASAGWWAPDGTWHPDNRWEARHEYYYGYHYRAPPVIYSAPYNYGYVPPPVIYDNTPGFSITIRP